MRLLDVGCSAGQFLFNVKDFVSEVAGIELDPAAAMHASSVCNCSVENVFLADSSFPKASFDVITAFQVMEHAADPIKFMRDIHACLKPGGIACVEVPNLEDALLSICDLSNYQRYYYRLVHLFYFSARSLQLLMEKTGFAGDVFFAQDYNIFNHINWMLNNSGQKDSRIGFSPVDFPQRAEADPEKSEELRTFFRGADDDYKRLVEKLGVAAKVGFIARKI